MTREQNSLGEKQKLFWKDNEELLRQSASCYHNKILEVTNLKERGACFGKCFKFPGL